jgi:hypothetical protein
MFVTLTVAMLPNAHELLRLFDFVARRYWRWKSVAERERLKPNTPSQ